MPNICAGAITARLESASLSQVAVSGHAAITAVYVTVRDDVWRTAPAEILEEETSQRPDGSSVTDLVVRHRLGAIDFQWHGTVISDSRSVRFTMVGEALNDFAANRIGFCLLHPQSLKGRRVHIDGPGGQVDGTFSAAIQPHQSFTDIAAMLYAVSDSDEVAIAFGGELFETEDHRNWSDPGWKTYCTPLSRPFPVRYHRGQVVEQVVDIASRTPMPTAVRGHAVTTTDQVEISVVLDAVVGRVPELGLGASGLPAVGEAAASSLRELAPAFLHVELEHAGPWRERLDSAAAEARELDVPLEVALVARASDVPFLAADMAARQGATIRAVSVFSPDGHSTQAGTVVAVRRELQANGCQAAVGGGSRANFAELNRGRFDVDTWDFVTYGVTPQVHHTDDDSILATTAALADALVQARTIGRGRPVTVGPISLRPRFNANTGAADLLPDPTKFGDDVDERQSLPITGVYLAAALTELVASDRVVIFRTVGARGMVTEDGRPTPASSVFREWSRHPGAPISAIASNHPAVTASVISADGEATLVVTNRSPQRLRFTVSGATIGQARVLTDNLPGGRGELPARSVVLFALEEPAASNRNSSQ